MVQLLTTDCYRASPGRLMSGGHSGQTDEETIAHCGQSFQCHVAGSLGSPFVVLLKQDGADEAYDGGLVGD